MKPLAFVFLFAVSAGAFVPLYPSNRISTTTSIESTIGALDLCDDSSRSDTYIRILEDKLIQFSMIADEDIRRKDFETFVTERLQEEISVANNGAFVEDIKLKSLNIVKAMDKSLLKLGQSIQDKEFKQSSFHRIGTSETDMWPYVDMLIHFKLLVSNTERMMVSGNKKTSKGCSCAGCTGARPCKDGRQPSRKPA